MTLRESRVEFTRLLAHLIDFAFLEGYEVALDEVTERITPKDRTSDHMTGSLHHMGLAADVLLYIEGVYQTDTAAYEKMGIFWKSLHQYNKWGGDFKHPDGNHFSFAPPEIVGNRG